MPTYPALAVSKSSTVEFIAEREVQRASNGAARARVLATPKRRFKIDHATLDATDCATLEAFYLANLASSFDFVWPLDGVTYSVIFTKEPGYKPLGGSLVAADVGLEEV